jgi:hypothetical protein
MRESSLMQALQTDASLLMGTTHCLKKKTPVAHGTGVRGLHNFPIMGEQTFFLSKTKQKQSD